MVELSSKVDGSDVVIEESVGSSAFPGQFGWLFGFAEGSDAHLRGCRLWDRRCVETIGHHFHRNGDRINLDCRLSYWQLRSASLRCE